MSTDFKNKLYQACTDLADERVNAIKKAIQNAQDASNNETQSTAGDKHDTARAMAQLDVEQKSKQLAEAKKLKMGLAQFSAESGKKEVGLGSLVTTSAAKYYISISVGKIQVEDEMVYAISPVSPIALAMRERKSGESFNFNGKEFEIIGID
ncbi:MAG: transcription elongation GreA/GreB family factor [Arenicella sp.]|jgi:transcription elongation GreA/GreB family factor